METFRFPRSYKWIMIASIVLFGGVILFSLFLPYLEPSDGNENIQVIALCIAVFGPLLWYAVKVLRLTDDYVMVDSTGITYVSPGSRRLFVQWRDIVSIRARDALQRLEVLGLQGRILMKLEYQLENFERLRWLLYGYTKDYLRGDSEGKVFTKQTLNRVLFLLLMCVTLAVAGLFLMSENLWLGLVVVGLVVLSVIGALQEPQKIRIVGNGIVIHYPIKRRELAFTGIVGVRLVNEQDQGNSVAMVLIEPKEGTVIKLAGFEGGSFALFSALDSAWRAQWESILASLPEPASMPKSP